jgi:hypothetical protein
MVNRSSFRVDPDRSINIFGMIDDNLVSSIAPQILRLRNSDDAPVCLLINSPGGSIKSYEMIKGLLRTRDSDSRRPRIIAVAIGYAQSAAADLLVQADYAIAYPSAELLFHGTRLESVRDITFERSSDLANVLAHLNRASAIRSATDAFGRAVFRYINARPHFDEAKEGAGVKITDPVECFATYIESRTSSEKTNNIIVRAVERLRRIKELLKYSEDRIQKLGKDEEIHNYRMFKFMLDYAEESDPGAVKSFSDMTRLQIFGDYDLLRDYLVGEHRNYLLGIVRRFGPVLLLREDSEMFFSKKFESQEQKDDYLLKKVFPELNSLWYFIVSLWRNLQEYENPLSAEDAYWLCAIDEVQGLNLPSTRSVFEEAQSSPEPETAADSSESQPTLTDVRAERFVRPPKEIPAPKIEPPPTKN